MLSPTAVMHGKITPPYRSSSTRKPSISSRTSDVSPGGQYQRVSPQRDPSPISTILLDSRENSPVRKSVDAWVGAGYRHEGPCISYNCSCPVARNRRAKALEEAGTHTWDRQRRTAWEVHRENLLTSAYGGPPVIPTWSPPRAGIKTVPFHACF